MHGYDGMFDDPECRLFDADEILWAAGLFEGEGCITLSGTQARLKLNSTDEDVVLRFHEAVVFGNMRVENSHIKRGWKRQWEWYCGSQHEVVAILEALVPHLGSRRKDRAAEIVEHIEQQWSARFRKAS